MAASFDGAVVGFPRGRARMVVGPVVHAKSGVALPPTRGTTMPGGSIPRPFPGCLRGTTAVMEWRVATWNINSLFVAAGHDRDRYPRKFHALDASDMIRSLRADSCSFCWPGGVCEGFLGRLGPGTFADSCNAGGAIVRLRRHVVADVASIVSRPNDFVRSLRGMVDFPVG